MSPRTVSLRAGSLRTVSLQAVRLRAGAAWVALLALGAGLAGCSRSPRPAVAFAVGDTSALADSADSTALSDSAASARDSTDAAPKPKPRSPRPTGGTASGTRGETPSVPPRTAAGDTAAPVVPQVTSGEAARLARQARSEIQQAEVRIAEVSYARLDVDGQQQYKMVQGFLSESRTALRMGEYERAAALARKAKLLAEGLTQR